MREYVYLFLLQRATNASIAMLARAIQELASPWVRRSGRELQNRDSSGTGLTYPDKWKTKRTTKRGLNKKENRRGRRHTAPKRVAGAARPASEAQGRDKESQAHKPNQKRAKQSRGESKRRGSRGEGDGDERGRASRGPKQARRRKRHRRNRPGRQGAEARHQPKTNRKARQEQTPGGTGERPARTPRRGTRPQGNRRAKPRQRPREPRQTQSNPPIPGKKQICEHALAGNPYKKVPT